MAANGILPRFVEEARKSYEAAVDSLNDLLLGSKSDPLPTEVAVDPDLPSLEAYLADCLSFERFGLHEKKDYDLRSLAIEGRFYAKSVTINFRKILFDVVAFNSGGHHRHGGRGQAPRRSR